MTKLCFNDDHVLRHHYPVPDPQYANNEKHFMKSCLYVFPIVATWMIFFGLHSFSSPVSPEFILTMCSQGTSLRKASERLRDPGPCLSLPHPSHGLTSAAPPSFMHGSATIVHNTPDKVSALSSTKSPECYFCSTGNVSSRGISSAWMCLPWLDPTEDNIHPD